MSDPREQRAEDNLDFIRLVQDEIGVDPDGWAGPKTHGAWGRYLQERHGTEALGGDKPRVSTTYRLPEDQYIPEPQPKDLIVLHHTAGGSAESTYRWWSTTPERIGTAFIIARDGTIHEVFPPECWAYHLGLRGTRGSVDRRSIGIEIASEGGLLEQDGRLYAFGAVSERTEYRGAVYRPPDGSWRRWEAFAAYTEPAVASVCALVDWLCERFEVSRISAGPVEQVDRSITGVCSHAQLRTGKSDVHPGFPWERLELEARLERS